MKTTFVFQNQGFAQVYWVIMDKLDPYSAYLYYFLKSVSGFSQIDLSQNQLVNATGMSKGSVNKAMNILKRNKIIIPKNSRSFHGADVYQMNDEAVAKEWDSDGSYSKERPNLWRLKG